MNNILNRLIIMCSAFVLNICDVKAQQIAEVFLINTDSINCVNNQSVDSVKNNKIKIESSVGVQSLLYDNFTLERYSKNPGIHFLGSATFPIGKKLSLSLSESLYYTPEKNNPTCENNVTDLILSGKLSDKFSADVGLEYSYYLKQKNADMLSVFLMLNYSPSDRSTIKVVPYKPLLLDGKKISDFYLLNEFTCTTSSNIKLGVNTVTSCTDNWKTRVGFTLSSPIGDNLSLGFSTIPKESESGNFSIMPKGFQWMLLVVLNFANL